jgi:uncharacterized OB-fold protein
VDLDETPVIGAIAPMTDGLDQPFWDGLRVGELRIQRCGACRDWIWGPQWTCPVCGQVEPGWESVELTGRVYSWTRTWHAFAAEYADHLPYVNVAVELPQAGGRRLLGVLVGDDDDADPRIGDVVEGLIQRPSALTSSMPVLRWRRRSTVDISAAPQ